MVNVFVWILFGVLILGFGFLSYYDFKYLEVPNLFSFVLMLFILLLNVVLYFYFGSDWSLSIGKGFVFSPYYNLLGAILLGLLFQLFVIISKERALGQGDVRIAIVVGLLLGLRYLSLWFYVTLVCAVIYIVYLFFKEKRFKGVYIPFVPFMLIGCVLVFLYLMWL